MSEQDWEDVPLFGAPVQTKSKAHWVLSKRDEEELARPRFARYRGPMVPCQKSTEHDRCRPVAWLLMVGDKEAALCARHKQEFLDRQTLDTPRGSQ